MIITLPKITVTNKFQMTAVVNAHKVITGFQPTMIQHNGQTVEGTKVYTDQGSFKVLCSPKAFGEGMMAVLATVESAKNGVIGEPVTVAPLMLGKGSGVTVGVKKLGKGK